MFPEEVLAACRDETRCPGKIQVPAKWPCYSGVELASSLGQKASWTVMFTVAVDPETNRRYPLEIVRKRQHFPDTIRMIQAQWVKWRPQLIYVESNAYQAAVVQELSRTIDYLETRDDIDFNKLGYYGFSWGANTAPIVLVVEERIDTAVLNVGGLWDIYRFLPEVDPLNFVTRVRAPVLMLNGEYDMQFRHIVLQDYTVLKESESTGNYKVITHTGDRASDVCLWPNMSHEDPAYNELMNNVEFKKALSYAINRDEINELFYFGLGTPRAVTAISSEPTYEEDVAKMHIKYDPDEANRILDELGFDKRDANGIRLGPDGKPIFFLFQFGSNWPQFGDVGQVVADYWKEIGIDSLVKPVERSVFYEYSYSNQIPMALFTSPGTSLGNAWWMMPTYHNSNGYGQWRTSGGKEGKEPPVGSKIRRAMELYEKAITAADFSDTIEMIKQILRWGVEDLWGIGIIGEVPAIGMVSNRMGNVPRKAPSGSHIAHPGNLVPEQFYIKE